MNQKKKSKKQKKKSDKGAGSDNEKEGEEGEKSRKSSTDTSIPMKYIVTSSLDAKIVEETRQLCNPRPKDIDKPNHIYLGRAKVLGTKEGSAYWDRRITHVIIGKNDRTQKVLKGIASGSFLVKPKWVEDSKKSGEWLDEHGYEADDWFPGAKITRRMRRHKKKGLFEEKKFYLGKGTDQLLKDLIMLAGGKIIADGALSISTVDYHIGSAEQASRAMTNKESGKPIIEDKWLLDSLQKGEILDTSQYEIDTKKIEEEAKKKRKSKRTKCKKIQT